MRAAGYEPSSLPNFDRLGQIVRICGDCRNFSTFSDTRFVRPRRSTGDRCRRSARPDFLIVDGSEQQAAELQLCRTIRRLWPQRYVYSLLLGRQAEVSDVTAGAGSRFR